MSSLASFGLLLMVVTILVGFTGVMAIVYLMITRRELLAKRVLWTLLGWGAVYMLILISTSLMSERTVLGIGQTKKFCGAYLDCHIGVTLTGVQTATTIGDGPSQVNSPGRFYIVSLRIENDARQVSLSLHNVTADVVDANGNSYQLSERGQNALAIARGEQFLPLDRTVEANRSYETVLVFELPVEAEDPMLRFTRGHVFTRATELFLIGDEDSFLHEPTVFSLSATQSLDRLLP